MKQYRVAVVGATGMVGRKFLQVLEERKLPVSEYFLFASARSAGKQLPFMGKTYTVRELTDDAFQDLGIDIAQYLCATHGILCTLCHFAIGSGVYLEKIKI